MSQTLQVEISDEAYLHLSRLAQNEGKTPAELGAEIVNRNIAHLLHDPLDEFIGKFNSGVSDAAENHDFHIGEALLKEMRGQEK